MKKVNYGSTIVDGMQFHLTSEADFTNRVMTNRMDYNSALEGEEYYCEFSAEGYDIFGEKVKVYWIHCFTKGNEPELDSSSLNWEEGDSVEYI